MSPSVLTPSPRRVSSQERSASNYFHFYSPRNRRPVSLLSAIDFGMAVRLDFMPDVVAYVERPQVLIVAERHRIDLSFWVRYRSGEEQLLLLIPAQATQPLADDQRQPRDMERLEAAALRSSIRLHYVYEAELVAERERLAAYFRLLPYVQMTRRIVQLDRIRQGIAHQFSLLPRMTFEQLVSALHREVACNVRAVASLMIHDGALNVDLTQPLSPRSVLSQACRP